MTQTIEKKAKRDVAAQGTRWRPPPTWARYTTAAVVAIVFALLQAAWVGFSIWPDEEDHYRAGVAAVLAGAAVLSLVGLLVAATVRRIGGRPDAAVVAAKIALAALAVAEVYLLLKIGPLAPSFD